MLGIAIQGHDGPNPTAAPPRGELLHALLDEVDIGLVLCTAQGRVLLANHAARSELAGHPQLALVGDELHAAAPNFAGAVRDVALSGRRRLLPLGDPPTGLFIYLLPLRAGGDGTPCVALLLGQRNRRSDLAFELLASVLHLTGAERDVLRALAAGQRAESIARDRCVALSTVRTQIMALRSKSGARCIAELLAMVAAMPPLAGALRQPTLRPACGAAGAATQAPFRLPAAATWAAAQARLNQSVYG